ncbi:hypothetical protein V6N11_052505 [Hibiscus sabdariffa]|uniref:Uncharacterized protein n=1 Tax=Hibiscus sabdariffa TaxID=183260 RepID=A0ABR2UA75_9ROSI
MDVKKRKHQAKWISSLSKGGGVAQHAPVIVNSASAQEDPPDSNLALHIVHANGLGDGRSDTVGDQAEDIMGVQIWVPGVSGDGSLVDFWYDSWVGDLSPLCLLCPSSLQQRLPYVSVRDMVTTIGEWRWDGIQHMLSEAALLAVAAIKPSAIGLIVDSVGWRGEIHHGTFMVISVLVSLELSVCVLPWNLSLWRWIVVMLMRWLPMRVNVPADTMARLAWQGFLDYRRYMKPPLVVWDELKLDKESFNVSMS